MNPSLRLRLTALVAVAAAGALCWVMPWGDPAWYALPLLAIAIAVSESVIINVTVARQQVTFGLSDGVVGAALLLAPGSWTVAAIVLGLLPVLVLDRQSALKIQYNLAQYFLATALAASVVAAIGGSTGGHVPAVVVGMIVWWGANQFLSAVPLSIMGREPLWPMVFEDAQPHAIHAAGTTSIGLLAAWLAVNAPFGLLGLLVPVLLLWMSFEEQTSKGAEARLFAELARGQERAATHSTDTSARVVLTAAARVLGGADVEMVLLEHDGPVVYSGDETGITRRRADSAAFDSPWVMRALGARGVATGSDDGRPFCSAVLGRADQPVAVLVARRDAGAAPFGRREAALAGLLVKQAESWLSVAEMAASRDEAVARAAAADEAACALGDIGATTAPALGVLHDSATRLAHLASQPQGADPVGDIVEELHAVERAVASLLGAIALAADPALRGTDADLDMEAFALGADAAASADGAATALPRRDDDWTTTGLVGADGQAASMPGAVTQ